MPTEPKKTAVKKHFIDLCRWIFTAISLWRMVLLSSALRTKIVDALRRSQDDHSYSNPY